MVRRTPHHTGSAGTRLRTDLLPCAQPGRPRPARGAPNPPRAWGSTPHASPLGRAGRLRTHRSSHVGRQLRTHRPSEARVRTLPPLRWSMSHGSGRARDACGVDHRYGRKVRTDGSRRPRVRGFPLQRGFAPLRAYPAATRAARRPRRRPRALRPSAPGCRGDAAGAGRTPMPRRRRAGRVRTATATYHATATYRDGHAPGWAQTGSGTPRRRRRARPRRLVRRLRADATAALGN